MNIQNGKNFELAFIKTKMSSENDNCFEETKT